MAMFAGAAFLFTGATMNRNSLPRVPLSSFLLTVLFGLVGLNFFAKGYAIESADLRRIDKAKTNLDALKEAVDRNKSSPHESGYPD